MTQVTVTVRTAEKDNSAQGGSEQKFYRTYQLPSSALFQWGSQRNGRSGGQFKIAPSMHDAEQQMRKKQAEGYVTVGGVEQFTVDTAKLQTQIVAGNKALGAFLDSLYAASATTGGKTKPFAPAFKPSKPTKFPEDTPGQPVPVERVFDRISQTNERALAAISLASNEPAKALTEYSLLQDEIDALEVDLRKVKSYMGTLEILVEEAMA